MFCFFFYSCLCVCVLVCVLMFCGRNVTALSVLSCLANCGSCYLGHLQHGLPLFYAFHFHVQFRIWRTLSLKDCTWKFNRRCSSFTSLQSTDSSVPPVPTAILRPTSAEYLRLRCGFYDDQFYDDFGAPCPCPQPRALSLHHTLSLCVCECVWYVRSSDWLNSNEMWNVIRLPAMCTCLFACQPCSQKGPTLKAESSSQ